ncbi:MAG: T9SS type A sorting domain-containing protein [Bacteroidales bacterium]
MKSNLLKNSVLLTILGAFFCVAVSVEALSPIVKTTVNRTIVKKQIPNKLVAKHVKKFRSKAAVDSLSIPVANYTYPGMIPYDGYANYISFNMLVNDYTTVGKQDYLFFPKDTIASYIDASTKAPTAFLWRVPGGSPAAAETQDLDVTYSQDGSYDFPTMRASNTDGSSTYTAEGRIKVGGKAEIASFNSLTIGTTYFPTYYEWQGSYGFVSGSNTYDDQAFGNLFILGQDSATVESVSVYLRAYPKAAVASNKVKLVLYEPGDDTGGNFKMNNKIVATAELKVSDMMPTASSVTGLAYADSTGKITEEIMGMANFKFAAPVKVSSLFFASLENFGNNLVAGDSLCILMNDLDPIPADSFKTIASNSSWSYSATTTGTHSWFPLSDVFGGSANPVLMICPVVNYSYNISSGIANTSVKNALVVRATKGFTVMGASEGEKVSAYTLSGQKVMTATVNSQRQTFTGLSKGVYIVKVGNANHKVAIY